MMPGETPWDLDQRLKSTIRADLEYLFLFISTQSTYLSYWMKYCSSDLLRRVFKQTFNGFG